MSFPDFEINESNPTFLQGQGGNDAFGIGNDWSNLGGNERSERNEIYDMVDQEEEGRIAKRREEEVIRRKAIEEKINFELKEKEARKVKGMEYLTQFEQYVN